MEYYIQRGKLKKVAISDDMVIKEFNVGEKDLEYAKQSFELQNFKWATIQSYYSIYHGVRALLFKAGYREESHIALRIAFKELYIDTGKLDESIYKTLRHGMDLRELADYKETFSQNGAEALINNVAKAMDSIKGYLSL